MEQQFKPDEKVIFTSTDDKVYLVRLLTNEIVAVEIIIIYL